LVQRHATARAYSEWREPDRRAADKRSLAPVTVAIARVGNMLEMMAARRPFEIRSYWDVGFAVIVDGRETWHDSFFDAVCARELGLEPLDTRNAFDAAYGSEIDARLAFDGDAFTVKLLGESARVASFAAAQVWLDGAVRRHYPASIYAFVPRKT
jgi:hypothetical protein